MSAKCGNNDTFLINEFIMMPFNAREYVITKVVHLYWTWKWSCASWKEHLVVQCKDVGEYFVHDGNGTLRIIAVGHV